MFWSLDMARVWLKVGVLEYTTFIVVPRSGRDLRLLAASLG